jgi:hypothetical protein
MTESNFRALCAELVDLLDCFGSTFNIPIETSVVARARAALAQPEPQGPTDEELREMWLSQEWFNEGATFREFASIVRRYGRPAIEPVPVSDPPGPKDCDAEGRCWLHQPHPATPETPEWRLMPARYASTIYDTTHWLPRWALPVPGVEGADD